jgi:tripartite-type tricarboxylate transporter receptor subunit TctC
MLRLAFCMLALLLPASAMAGEFPDHDIRFIAPFSAGGPTDTAGRLIAEPLRQQLGQNVYIENVPGASGVIGTQQVVNGTGDGYTLLIGGIAPIVLVPAVKTLRYNVGKDLVPLGLIWRSPEVLAVRASLKVNSVAELVDHLRTENGKTTYGSAGIGTATHLAAELFEQEAKVQMTHVPYKSTSNSVADLMGGHIDMIFGDIAILQPLVQAGMVKGLAVTSPARSSLLPDLPTMGEVGFPNVQTEVWFGLFAPASTPAPALERLKAAVLRAQKDPDYIKALSRLGINLGEPGAEELARFVQDESKRWTPILKRAGITFN